MDLSQRLADLESIHDWYTLVEELEKAIAAEADPAAKALLHVRLGSVLDGKFLQTVKALKHFQDAYKLAPSLLEALEHARKVYWALGKVNMVQKLLELEIKNSTDAATQVALSCELGDVLVDAGDLERAAQSYSRALELSGGTHEGARDGLFDAQLDAESWEARVAQLVGEATSEKSGAKFLRAARVVKRFAADEHESMLVRAYQCAPTDLLIAAALETLFADPSRADELRDLQGRITDRLDGAERARALHAFGARWATRHQNFPNAAESFQKALEVDPADDTAVIFLRELWGAKDGAWPKVAAALEAAADKLPSSPFLPAQIGIVWWRHLGDLIKARAWFERLQALAPSHPTLALFEQQIGHKLDAARAPSIAPAAAAAPSVPPQDVDVDVATDEAEAPEAPHAAPEPSPEPPPVAAAEAAAEAAPAAAPAAAAAPAPALEPEPVGASPEKIAELKAKAEKQEQAKRFNEYVKTLVELAEAVPDEFDKVEYYLRAADLYTNKFSNAAEAVKCYEAVLQLDGENPQAIEFLRQSYEKRRDWEKLIGLMRREASSLPEGGSRAAKFLEIARLATERVKKPEVCIDLWNEVVGSEPDNAEALGALAGLHERAKDWGALADTLRRQADVTSDLKQKEIILGKLGQLFGERLNDDEAAVEAWQQLLAINPQDRKAQEAVKKKYLALGRWDDLEVFYAESGKWDEFIRVLEAQEAKETDDKAKISLLMKTAELWMAQKGKPDRAAKAYEKVLSIEASHLAAAEALIPIYQQANNAKGLASVVEVKLSHEEEPVAKLSLLRDVAALYETKLKETPKAFERFLTAFEMAPMDDQAIEDVERLARATTGWEELVSAYRRAIEKAAAESDDRLVIDLRLRLGRVLVDELGRIDDALAEYRAVYEAESDNAHALEALERLYKQTKKYAELLGIYERKRELAEDAEGKRQVLYGIAGLYESELRDRDRAIATYCEVLEEEATDATALEALDRLYREAEAWEPYVDVLRKRIELDVGDAVLVDLKYRLGSTLEKHLGDAAGALENYKEILFLDPENDLARGSLETLLDNEALRAEAASILQDIYETREDWSRLVQALEILAAAAGTTEERVALLRKIARVCAQSLGDNQRAFDAQARALSEDPANVETRGELEQLADGSGAWDRLEGIFSDVAGSLEDASLARDYWMRLGAIEERLAKVDAAAKAYEKVLSLDTADAEALAALDALYRRTERWTDLIGVFRRRIELASEPEERERLYGAMAEVQEQKLGQPEEAIAAYREVLSLDPSSALALTALDALFGRLERWEDLADNLEAQLRLAEEDELQLYLMLRLAALREGQMAQVETAIDIYRQVLERDPANADALAALERLGKLPEHELGIAEILEPLYRQSGDYAKLIGVHEVQVKRAEDALRRVELLHQIANLYEDAGSNLDAAFDTMARALEQDPSNEATIEGLDRLARAVERFVDLAKVYEGLANKQEDSQLASALTTMAARVQEGDIGNLDEAIRLYRRVLEIDPQNLDAAESLERIFRQVERYAELSQALQTKSDIVEDLAEKKAALFQAASIEEEVLERPEQAIAAYNRILDLEPEDVHAVDALIRLFLGLTRWTDLLVVYNKKADLVADPDEKKRIYYQVGAVYERELSDVVRAIDTYQRVLEIDPEDVQALGRLDVLYQTAQNWPELLGVLQREADLAQDPAEGISYQYRIAELYEKHLDDVARAVELYRDLLQQMPDHAPTLQALEGIKDGAREAVAAALVLEPIYDALGEWQRLISVLEVQAKAAEDAFQRVELLHRVARLHEEMIGDHEAAFRTFARAAEADVTNEDSLANLERLASVVGKWADVAALYDAQLDGLGEDVERFVELGLRLAQIFEVQLEDVDNAVARYRRVLKIEPENVTAIGSLDRLFSQTGRWQELADVLVREAEISQAPEEALEFKFRLGQVRQHQLADVPGAIGSYREVIQATPDHPGALEALEGLFAAGTSQLEIGEILEPLYESSGEWEKLAGVLEAQLRLLTEPADRLAMYYRLAELHDERLVAPDGALQVYVRALKEAPSDERTLEEIERFAGQVDGGWEAVANAYADVLQLHAQPEVQRAIGKRLARVFEEELGDVARAEETYRYVLGVEPLDADALAQLDRIYTGLEQYPELAATLEQRVKATTEPYELVELYTRLGLVYEEQLRQLDDAVRAFRRIFDELDRQNEQAILALERVFAAKEAWPQLKEVYDRQLELAGGDTEQAEILAKTAHLLAGQLGQTNEAIDTWRRVLELRGDDPEALGALANLHESLEQWAELCDVLERHYDIADGDEARVAVLLRRARLYVEQLRRDDSALDDYNRVLDIDYGNVEALYAISDIWRRRQDPNEIVQSLHMTVDRAAQVLPPENVVALQRELGTLYQQTLQQPFEAIEAWRKLLEVSPGDFEALAALETLLRAEERWVEVIEVKMARAEALEEPAEKVREWLECTALWEQQVGDKDGGVPAFEKILEVEPTHDGAFFALEELHGAAGRAEPLIELYLARLETREEVADRTLLLRKVARVFDEQLDDRAQAFDALVTAFEMDFTDNDTVKQLEKVTAATSRWPELVQTVNGWLQEQKDPIQKIQLCLRLAKWYAEDLGHPEYAQPYYQQVLALDPNNVAVLRQMASFFKKSGQWQQQGQTLTSALNVAVSDVDRKEILTDLGEVLEKQMKDVDQALTFYKRALDVDPHHVGALEALERIYGERGELNDLVDVVTRKAKGLTDPAEVAATKVRAGGLYESSLGQPEKAAQLYREALDVEGGNLLAMRGLERVYGTLHQWQDLVKVLEMQLDVVTTEAQRIEVLLKIAAIQEQQFLKPDLAAARLEQAVEIDPTNESALDSLERCYRRLRQWHDLINTYDRHVNATLDRQKKCELWSAMAHVYSDELEDVEKAIDSHLNIVDIEPANIPALEALAKLYEKQDDSSRAIDYMTRVADLTTDGKQRVDMYYRVGRQLDEKLGDRVSAQEKFEMALDLDPTHLPSLAALRTIAMDSADWDRAARYLDQEQMNTEAPRQKARLLVELGKLRSDMLGERELAVQAYEMALQSDGDNEDAALPLVDHYVESEQWSRAEPLAEMLVRKSGKRERGEQQRLYKTQGKVLAALEKNEQALKAYQHASQLDLTDQEVIRGIAEVCFKLGDWPGSLSNFQKVLTSLGEEETEQRAYVYWKLGLIKQHQGQAKQAINNFEKALGIEPAHRQTLEAMVAVYDGLKDYKQVCHYKRAILDNLMDGGERFRMLVEIADIWSDKDGNAAKAVEALEEAIDYEPQNHVILHKMLQLYQKTSQWDRMVDTVQRIADLETQPERKSRYLYTMAQLYRDKLDDPTRAVELFNEALDLNPGFLEAFERINKILTAQKEWKLLERAYRKMLHRIAGKGNNDLEYNLWHALGLIYRDRLEDQKVAIEAFRMASRLKPDMPQELEILAELYEQTEDFDEAVATFQALIKIDPLRVDPYRRLYQLNLRRQTYDQAWAVAGILAFLQRADEEEKRFYDDYKPQGLLAAKARLDNEQWVRNLFHEDESLYVGKIFEMIVGAAVRAKIEQLKAKKEYPPPSLDPRFRQDPEKSTVTFARTFGWAAQVLGLPCPLLYVRSDVPGALVAVANEHPASVAGQTVLTGFTTQELTFIVGKHLAMYRGEHYIKTLFPTVTELTVLLFAGIKMADASAPVPADIEKQVVATVQGLRQFMQPIQLEHLKTVVKKFIADGARANVKRWVQTVELTAARAGLLLSGDLEVAKKILAAEPQQPGDLTAQEKLKDLLVFAASDQYTALRAALGVAVSAG